MKKATARRQRATSQVGRHRCHGDPRRFAVVADFVADRFSHHRYVADVAGGQGLLAKALKKRHNFEAEVIDPRGWVVKGVPHRQEDFVASMSSYYDLILGLHPDDAIAEVVKAARERPTILVPCCNFWDRDRRLSRDQLLEAIIDHHVALSGTHEHVELPFKGPHNHALILEPPSASDAMSARTGASRALPGEHAPVRLRVRGGLLSEHVGVLAVGDEEFVVGADLFDGPCVEDDDEVGHADR